MTRQEAFDIACKAVIAQGKPSRLSGGRGRCMYRGPNGLKCALGHLFPDEMYSYDMESYSPMDACEELDRVLAEIGLADDDDRHFLAELQRCHDKAGNDTFVQDFKRSAFDVAVRHGLDASCLEDA